jgi:hypothetical protein
LPHLKAKISFTHLPVSYFYLKALPPLQAFGAKRGLLSAELANLDLLISTLFAEICPDLADDAQLETSNANNAGTTETYNAHEGAEDLAMRAAKSQTSQTSQADIPQLEKINQGCKAPLQKSFRLKSNPHNFPLTISLRHYMILPVPRSNINPSPQPGIIRNLTRFKQEIY